VLIWIDLHVRGNKVEQRGGVDHITGHAHTLATRPRRNRLGIAGGTSGETSGGTPRYVPAPDEMGTCATAVAEAVDEPVVAVGRTQRRGGGEDRSAGATVEHLAGYVVDRAIDGVVAAGAGDPAKSSTRERATS
jgi:hypothetical protein